MGKLGEGKQAHNDGHGVGSNSHQVRHARRRAKA
jgi:hypothetical protein